MGDEIVRLSVEVERLRAENDQLRKWAHYVEKSMSALALGLADGLREWVDSLSGMSPLNGGAGPDEGPVDPQ